MCSSDLSLRFQDVVLLASTSELQTELLKRFESIAAHSKYRLDILVCPTNDSWIRDYGGMTVRAVDAQGSAKQTLLSFQFNSWGGKYPPHDLDDAIPRHVAQYRSLPLFSPGMILEGGSIEVNGRGTLMTTEACLLNPNRNPTLNRTQIEQRIRD